MVHAIYIEGALILFTYRTLTVFIAIAASYLSHYGSSPRQLIEPWIRVSLRGR